MTARGPAQGRREARGRGNSRNLVRFEVGDTLYAFDVQHVEEVILPGPVSLLPHMANSVVGVSDHRGRVVPIIDLRLRFGLEARSQSRTSKWVLVRSSQGLVGFVVDQVHDVVGAESLSAPPHVGGMVDERALRGVIQIGESMVFVLDEDKLASVLAGMEIPELDQA